MSVDVDITLRRGDFTLAVRFSSQARTIGITGPSGSGKTTLLNVIAGTARPDRGRVSVGGRVFVDPQRGIFLAPHRRNLGYVFQEGRLFPHLTVEQNLHYGRWFGRHRPLPVTPARIIELLGIGHLLHRRAAGLSGGEQQRVAIGRALFAAPRLLLMDEPLSALDAERRLEILPLIERVREEAKVPLLYVSHVQGEIRRLADQIITIEHGRLVALNQNGGVADDDRPLTVI